MIFFSNRHNSMEIAQIGTNRISSRALFQKMMSSNLFCSLILKCFAVAHLTQCLILPPSSINKMDRCTVPHAHMVIISFFWLFRIATMLTSNDKIQYESKWRS